MSSEQLRKRRRSGGQARRLLGGLLAAAALTGWGCSQKKAESADVIILQSGRMRGNVYPQSLQNIAPLQHYPYLAGYVKKVRDEAAKTGAKVFLIDLGDSLGGSFASHATGYGNMVSFFNETGYDAIVLGNLDNNIPPEALARLKATVLNPFMAPDGRPATEGTKFGARLDRGGLSVEILANFYGAASKAANPERFPTWFGSTAADVSPVRDYAPIVKSLGERPEGALTLLSWMKFESPKNPPIQFLASLDTLGVDAILAHRIYSGSERDVWSESTFYDWKPPVSENILRNNGGFTLARLDLKRDGPQWRVLKQELLPMTANTAPADPGIAGKIALFEDQITKADKPLGELPDSVSEEQVLTAYLRALSAIAGTQIAAYSRESIRSSWPAGVLTASRVFNSLPWTTAIVQLTLTPEQVEKLGGISGVVFLKREGLVPGEPVTVTTSRFFASLLADRLGLPGDAIRETGRPSEFDFFVDSLATKPLSFAVPAGWVFVDPRG